MLPEVARLVRQEIAVRVRDCGDGDDLVMNGDSWAASPSQCELLPLGDLYRPPEARSFVARRRHVNAISHAESNEDAVISADRKLWLFRLLKTSGCDLNDSGRNKAKHYLTIMEDGMSGDSLTRK